MIVDCQSCRESSPQPAGCGQDGKSTIGEWCTLCAQGVIAPISVVLKVTIYNWPKLAA